jgi:hypothetical protein
MRVGVETSGQFTRMAMKCNPKTDEQAGGKTEGEGKTQGTVLFTLGPPASFQASMPPVRLYTF